jgi:hypothetical protein
VSPAGDQTRRQNVDSASLENLAEELAMASALITLRRHLLGQRFGSANQRETLVLIGLPSERACPLQGLNDLAEKGRNRLIQRTVDRRQIRQASSCRSESLPLETLILGRRGGSRHQSVGSLGGLFGIEAPKLAARYNPSKQILPNNHLQIE